MKSETESEMESEMELETELETELGTEKGKKSESRRIWKEWRGLWSRVPIIISVHKMKVFCGQRSEVSGPGFVGYDLWKSWTSSAACSNSVADNQSVSWSVPS